MCGIFGYIGKKDPAAICIEGLKKLEYRGYDSAGIGGLTRQGALFWLKTPGKVKFLEEKWKKKSTPLQLAIAHTRWATHGVPTENNAHPHTDQDHSLMVVHNGIIENYASLRQKMIGEGRVFSTDTDTEVLAQLIASFYKKDLLEAIRCALSHVEGSFAIAVVHQDFPSQIIVASQFSPMTVGIGEQEVFIASDPAAFVSHTRQVQFLKNGEIGVVTASGVTIVDRDLKKIERAEETLEYHHEVICKKGFEHYMLKEIFEQPQSIHNVLLSRYSEELGIVQMDTFSIPHEKLAEIEQIQIIACGSSYHAGLLGGYVLEEQARIPTRVEVASEFRYKNPIVPKNSLVIVISQSGETADTIAAAREVLEKGAFLLSVCNVANSSLARQGHACILLRAGAEIGVASTKAFTSQVVALFLLSLLLARAKNMSKAEGIKFIESLKKLPGHIESILARATEIEKIAQKYAHYNHFFYLGRHYQFPIALEGALKLKEISYINACAYPAGEMKHGPIALIDPGLPTLFFACNRLTYDKSLSSIMEIKARNGRVIGIDFEGSDRLLDLVDDCFLIPDVSDEMACILAAVVGQLFAYYVAKERGTEIDQPRNLAKSVTVE